MAKDSFASAHLHWQRRGPSQFSPKGFRRGLFGRSVKCVLRCTNDLLRPCNCGSRRPSVSATTVADIRATGLVIDDAGRERLVAARIGTFLLLVCLAIVYSGGERYFYLISRTLEYGFDLLMIACIVLVVSTSEIRMVAVLDALPYLGFVVAYTVWGLVVSPIQWLVASSAVSAVLLNVLLFAGIFVGVLDRRRLATLAYLIQLAVLVNVALVLWEAVDYTLTRSLANFAHTAYYVLERPGGLWVQPNDAAIALLFGALLSFWA